MKLTYIYHSGFALEFDKFAIIIDYYRHMNNDSENILNRLLKSEKPLYVLVSHSHDDHFNPDILTWKNKKKNIVYIFSHDILETKKANKDDAIYLNKLESYKDGQIEVKAFGSTDLGISFAIKAGNKHIFHAGDLNNWHWKEESTDEEIKEAEVLYHKELAIISNKIKHFDLAMFPVDPRLGKDFAKGAEEFINSIHVDTLAPMHFSSDPEKIKIFEPIAHKYHCKYICWKKEGETSEI